MFDRYTAEPSFQHAAEQRTGLLLINLGTPDAPTAKAVKNYLREFLSDPRVVELPGWLWQPLLRGVILNTRPRQSARKYAAIWTADGSPLRLHTERLNTLVKDWLTEHSPHRPLVDYAMRYGQPSIADAIDRLRAQNVQRLLVLPLYPQYAASSTGSAQDEVFRVLSTLRNPPELRVIKQFHDFPAYIQALAQSITDFWNTNGRPGKLLMSFHGVPKFSLERGDPYHCACHKTARLLAEALGLGSDDYQLSFQSRFGRTEWLQPYTSVVLQQLGQQRMHRVDVVCPGFAADCLETLEEIAMEGKTLFVQAGGGELRYIPALNDNAQFVEAIGELVSRHFAGWTVADQESNERAQRALALGAKH